MEISRGMDLYSNTKLEHLRNLSNSISSPNFEPKDKELYAVCTQFEAIFIKQMLDAMRKTVDRTPISDSVTSGTGRDFFEDMLYDEYAKDMAKTANFGIAKMAYMQLYREQK